MLLSISYVLMFCETVVGLVIACIIINNNMRLTGHQVCLIVLFLMLSSSGNFIVRVLRQYRIYISTYIENGIFGYNKTLQRKERLKNSWNILIGFIYTSITAVILVCLFAEYSDLEPPPKLYDKLFEIILTLKTFETFIELICCIRFMNKNINKVYRIEAFVMVLLSSSLIVFLGGGNVMKFLKYGTVSIQRMITVIFLDSYILCLLTKESHKKPLLPPIYMINSSLYITEIKLVYEAFMTFIDSQDNEEWKNCVGLLMEIQIIKQNKCKISDLFNNENRERVKKLSQILIKKISVIKDQGSVDFIDQFEYLLIEFLDMEAFKKFMKSSEYEDLNKEFHMLNR